MGTPIGIFGFGVEGRSTLAWLLKRGITDITVFDRIRPTDLPDGIAYGGSGEDDDKVLLRMGTVFRSAGIRPDMPALAAFKAAGGNLTSQIEMAFAIAGRDRILGVTGTLGKGTCCSLLEAMLDAAGLPCVLAGNIGIPALDAAESLPEKALFILELSSFQLSTLSVSPRRAAILRTTVEHLDWHVSRREYWDHKANLVAHQQAQDFTVFCSDVEGSRAIASKSPARKRSYGREGGILIRDGAAHFVREGRTLHAHELQMPGGFNLENIAAAAALALDCGASIDAVFAAARSFKGLEHRLERVREHEGITFYNDSYATRPDATEGAITALSGAPLGLILGGSDKQVDFAYLGRCIAGADHLCAIAFIGATGPKLNEAVEEALTKAESQGRLRPRPAMALCEGLADSLAFLRAQVPYGGNIALSPACASFGLFANYKERGKLFKAAVNAL